MSAAIGTVVFVVTYHSRSHCVGSAFSLAQKRKRRVSSSRKITTSRNSLSRLPRREFLNRAVGALTLSTLFAGLPKGWAGGLSADDSPEVANLKFGIIALTDN